MPTSKYIPPSKTIVSGRPLVQNQMVKIDPTQSLNHVQFVKTLAGTSEEVFSHLIRQKLNTFHGTLEDWRNELKKLLAAPL